MYATLLCLTLAANPVTTRVADQASLDGSWTVVCVEKDGQAMADAKGKTVTVKDNTFTCMGKDGKAGMTFKIDFAKNGTIGMTEIAKDDGTRIETPSESKQGVYVLSSEYLAICVHDDTAAASTAPQQKSKCTILLQREGARRDRN